MECKRAAGGGGAATTSAVRVGPNGLPLDAAAAAGEEVGDSSAPGTAAGVAPVADAGAGAGGKGLFRYRWYNGPAGIMRHVQKKHADLLKAVEAQIESHPPPSAPPKAPKADGAGKGAGTAKGTKRPAPAPAACEIEVFMNENDLKEVWEKHGELFTKNEVTDLKALVSLNDTDLRDSMGLALGPRRKIQKALADKGYASTDVVGEE